MNLSRFFAELKRRNVYKVAVAYAVVGWLMVQVTTQVFPIFEIPNWASRLIVLAIIIGFPIALVIASAFELTPQGCSRRREMRCSVIPIWPALPKSKLALEPRPTPSQFFGGYLLSPQARPFPSRG